MIQITQDISSSVQCKKRRRSGLRRGFLYSAIGKIDKSRYVSYLDPKDISDINSMIKDA